MNFHFIKSILKHFHYIVHVYIICMYGVFYYYCTHNESKKEINILFNLQLSRECEI